MVNVEKPERMRRLFQAAVGIRIEKKSPKATDRGRGFPRLRHFPQAVFFFFFGSFFFFFFDDFPLWKTEPGRVTNRPPYCSNG